MSYILDALKKAERERGPAEIPTIETVHDLHVKKKTGVLITAGCGALCLIAAGWLYFWSSSGLVESKDQAFTALNHDFAIKASDVPPENREFTDQDSKTPASDDIVLNLPSPKTAIDPVAAAPETKPQPVAGQPDNLRTNAEAASPAASITDETVQKSPPDHDSAELFAPAAAKPAASKPKPQQLSKNVPSLREIAASMKMSIHVYSDNTERRMVFINGVRYAEGASLEHGCVLESITPEGAILKRGDETIALRSGGI